MLQEANSLLDTLKDYYVNYRRKYIVQLDNGAYPHVKNKYTKEFVPLTDKVLERHLEHKETIGIFCGNSVKFICFDIDTGKEEDLRLLVSTLLEKTNVREENIATSVSGNKGYHVEIFFDKPLTFEIAEDFYYKILLECDFDADEVELRPRSNIGVKLPLGLNRVTGVKCNYIDWLTYAEIPDRSIQDVVKLDKYEFIRSNELTKNTHKIKYNSKIYNREINNKRIFNELRAYNDVDTAKEMADMATSIDYSASEVNSIIASVVEVLERGYFTPKDMFKRHDYAYFISIFLKEQGVEQEATINKINQIMLSTREQFKDLIKSSEEFTVSETERIVNLVYSKNYKLIKQQHDIYFTNEEFLDMLTIEKYQQRRLYLAMLGHSKRFNRTNKTFCMTFETMRAMNIKNNGTDMSKNLKELADNGYIEIIRGGKINEELLKSHGVVQRLPNIYRIKKSFNQNTPKKVLVKADASNSDAIDLLTKAYKNNVIDFKTIKTAYKNKQLSRRQFYKFKQSL